ncbi:MAG: peptidylprolyl isomerase [Aquificaceae bacterium]|nr:peptidylprolyl isomerase [Aquificaceae bacterium]MDW8433227.1 peptidylprolyl isomerase [Aquificaceae bacterium]
MVSGRFKKILCGILLSTAIAFSTTLVDRVVASVNSEPILESDLKMGMLFYGISDRKQLINKLVDDMLVYQFLLSRGMRLKPEIVEEAIQDLAKTNKTTVEGIASELAKYGLSLQDMRRFMEREMVVVQGIRVMLERDTKVSEIEVEVEKLRRGEVKVLREVELLVLEKKEADKLLNLLPVKELEELARAIGKDVERMKVSRGDLVEALDKEVWRSGMGEIIVAEDADNIYIGKVLSQEEYYEGKSLEEIRQELFLKKMQEKRDELIQRLRKNSVIKMLP